MSLIHIRRERREMGGSGSKRPPSPVRLVIGLILVLMLIWYLGTL